MDQKDLKQIKQVVDESIAVNNKTLKKELRLEFTEALAVQSKGLKGEMKKRNKALASELRSEMAEQKKEVTAQMAEQKKEIKLEMLKQTKDIRLEVGDIIENSINPQLENMSNKLDKDYIDKKNAEVRGELVLFIKNEGTRTKKLSKMLYKKKILTKTELKQLEQVK